MILRMRKRKSEREKSGWWDFLLLYNEMKIDCKRWGERKKVDDNKSIVWYLCRRSRLIIMKNDQDEKERERDEGLIFEFF